MQNYTHNICQLYILHTHTQTHMHTEETGRKYTRVLAVVGFGGSRTMCDFFLIFSPHVFRLCNDMNNVTVLSRVSVSI